jgi:hypothetical protein
MELIPITYLFGQTLTIVKRPLCPTFIHDDTTRLIVSVIGIVICSGILWKVLRKFNG